MKLQTDEKDLQAWTMKSLAKPYEEVVELLNTGLSQKKIATELGVHPSTICRHVNEARDDGVLPAK